MRITKITAYQADLHYAGKGYAFSQGRSYTAFPTTVIEVETDESLSGVDEICPCGPAYLPGYSEGVLPALQALAPQTMNSGRRAPKCFSGQSAL